MTTFVRTGYRRVNESLAHNATSGRTKVALENRCRACGWTPPIRYGHLTRHHLVPQAWFLQRKQELRLLRNANANIVPLCRRCHEIVDGRDPVPRLQKRAALRQALHSSEVSFILQIRGRQWLDAHYPLDP